VSRTSRRVSTAPMAVTSAGEILVNIAASAGPLDPLKLVERAMAERRPIFVGIVATPKEVRFALKSMDDATAEISSWIWGSRQRHLQKMARRQRGPTARLGGQLIASTPTASGRSLGVRDRADQDRPGHRAPHPPDRRRVP
jgi:hypothetical protein